MTKKYYNSQKLIFLFIIIFISTNEVFANQAYFDISEQEIEIQTNFKGKEVIITGRVTSIDADFYDNAQINLSTGDEWGFGSCTLSPPTNNQDFAYDLDKGQYVKLKCKDISEVMGFPQASSCKLVN